MTYAGSPGHTIEGQKENVQEARNFGGKAGTHGKAHAL